MVLRAARKRKGGRAAGVSGEWGCGGGSHTERLLGLGVWQAQRGVVAAASGYAPQAPAHPPTLGITMHTTSRTPPSNPSLPPHPCPAPPRLLCLQGVKSVLQQCYGDPAQVTDELVEAILTPGLQPGAVDVFLDFISYSSGPLPEEQLKVGVHAWVWGRGYDWG